MLGIGLNVSLRADELPVPTAASLALAGAQGHRPRSAAAGDPALAGRLVRGLARAPAATRTLCRLQETYAAGCATLGRAVRAELPGGRELVGEAVAVDADGRLVIAAEAVVQPVGAGDVRRTLRDRRDSGAHRGPRSERELRHTCRIVDPTLSRGPLGDAQRDSAGTSEGRVGSRGPTVSRRRSGHAAARGRRPGRDERRGSQWRCASNS